MCLNSRVEYHLSLYRPVHIVVVPRNSLGFCIDRTPIKTIQSTKLLGLTINDTLTWDEHIEELVKKASKKVYFLIRLKCAHVPTSDLVTNFCVCIRSSLDYAGPVFHYRLPKYLQVELERVQRRLCIFPRVHYSGALLGRPSFSRASVHQGPPGKLNRTPV